MLNKIVHLKNTVILFLLLLTIIAPSSLYASKKYNNALGIFLGATTSPESTQFTYGGEYFRRFSPLFGMLLVVEHTPRAEHKGEHTGDLVSAALLTVNPYKDLYLGAGGGIKTIFNEKTEGLARLYAGYSFALGHGIKFTPNISADFAGGNVDAVYGIMLSKGFD